MFSPVTGEWTPPRDVAKRLEVIVLVGLQGSGKSTFYRERFAATHDLVSRDRFRSHARPTERQRRLIEDALARGRSVVVDNTNPAVKDRAGIIEAARTHGARTVCYFFEPDVRASIARNARREGKERVPVVGILATAKRLVAPSLGEGFDELFLVTPQRDGGFDVREAPPAAPAGGGGAGPSAP